MNFKVGQKVVCTAGTDGTWTGPGIVKPGPKKDDVVTVSGFDGDSYIYLSEYNHGHSFNGKWFRPLQDLSAVGINDLLEILPFIERREKVNI